MSREIRFRVWSEDTKSYHNCEDWRVQDLMIPENRSGNVVEQYTGLKDKNGKEIYEGDIVKKTDAISKIEFYDDVACFGYSENTVSGKPIRYAIKGEEIEIIGNIHENKEINYYDCNRTE